MKAILFDLGDTLLEETNYDLKAGFEAINHFLKPDVTHEQMYADTKQAQKNSGEFQCLEWLQRYVASGSPSVEDIEWLLWQHTVFLKPVEGVYNMLSALRQKTIPYGLVSNAPFSSLAIKKELERHDITDYQFVISSGDKGIAKPAVSIFDDALAMLNLPAHEIWFVGDRVETDIIGAQSVGMVPKLRRTPKLKSNIDCAVFDDWSEFINWL